MLRFYYGFIGYPYYITKPKQTQEFFIGKEGDFLSKMYSCEEIAERYGVQTITVWDWIRKKKLPAIRIGKGYRISEDQLETFEDKRRTVPKAE